MIGVLSSGSSHSSSFAAIAHLTQIAGPVRSSGLYSPSSINSGNCCLMYGIADCHWQSMSVHKIAAGAT
ncbi:hypothetical protein VCSRO169_3395 [Vibrio cholerae]|nr:hypothetical protein VCSRO169_3395 [Vibrio cholerae]